MATKAELWVKYYVTDPKPKTQPLQVVESTADTIVLPYHLWMKNKCKCCGKGGASGLWKCEFTTYVATYMLCAACGLREAFAKWNGFFSPKLEHIDLMYTFTYPSRTEVPEEPKS